MINKIDFLNYYVDYFGKSQKTFIFDKNEIKNHSDDVLNALVKFIWGEKEAVVGNNLYQEIFNTYSDNTISRNVEIKIIILNYYESINLKMQANKITVKELADFISNLPNVNERIKNDYTSIASEIAVNKGNIFLLSLASKYCFYQNRYAYGKND